MHLTSFPGETLMLTVGFLTLFLLQLPFVVLAACLALAKLKLAYRDTSKVSIGLSIFWGLPSLPFRSWPSSFFSTHGGHFPWASWLTIVLGSAGLTSLVMFVWVETSVAAEPI